MFSYLEHISPGAMLLQHQHGLLGLAQFLDLIRHNKGHLGDLLDHVS